MGGGRMFTLGIPGGSAAPAPPAWSPADLPDLELWLPNSFLATIGDAQPIAQWDDASGLDRHAVQATATSRPTARLTGGIWEADFDGVDDYFDVITTLVAQPTTIAFVGNVTGSPQAFVDGASPRQLIRSSVDKWNIFAGNNVNSVGASDSSVHYFVTIFDGATSSLRVDGSVVLSGDAGVQGFDDSRIGKVYTGGSVLGGVLKTFIVCSSVLAGDDLANLETHLAGLV